MKKNNMKKLLLLLLFIPLMTCSDDDDDSLLRITNNTNEDFRITQISFVGYEFSDLNIQYGESQTYNLSDGLSVGSSNININISYICGSNGWTSSFNVDLTEGSTTSFNFLICPSTAGYCRSVCLE